MVEKVGSEADKTDRLRQARVNAYVPTLPFRRGVPADSIPLIQQIAANMDHAATERRAVIDLGTNSAKLLVGEVEGYRLTPLHSASEATQLGMGMGESDRLDRVAIGHTAAVVKDFLQQAARFDPVSVRVVATSAARDAANRDELLSAVNRESGLDVEIISGEREAELVFLSVTSDPAFASGPIVVFDAGGGSTEVSIGENPFILF